jgi:hypothetical protein
MFVQTGEMKHAVKEQFLVGVHIIMPNCICTKPGKSPHQVINRIHYLNKLFDWTIKALP